MNKHTQDGTSKNCNRWIDCGTVRDADMAYLAMFRYTLETHEQIGQVLNIIKANAPRLTRSLLCQLDLELQQEEVIYQTYYSNRRKSNYGDENNRKLYMLFHCWVKEQLEKIKKR